MLARVRPLFSRTVSSKDRNFFFHRVPLCHSPCSGAPWDTAGVPSLNRRKLTVRWPCSFACRLLAGSCPWSPPGAGISARWSYTWAPRDLSCLLFPCNKATLIPGLHLNCWPAFPLSLLLPRFQFPAGFLLLPYLSSRGLAGALTLTSPLFSQPLSLEEEADAGCVFGHLGRAAHRAVESGSA